MKKTTARDALKRIRSHYQMFGFWDTTRNVLAQVLARVPDGEFDRKYGTDTGAALSMRHDERPEPEQIVRSLPTHPTIMKYVLRNLGIDHRDFVFIDFGCGKGRTLLCASDFPFQRITGVEWSGHLCDIARHNVEVYRSDTQKCAHLEALCMNVLDYPFPSSNIVLYMYNPFGPTLLMRVFENISKHMQTSKHRFLVVFTGLGRLEEVVVMNCFERNSIEVAHLHGTITPRGSWILGEGQRRRTPTPA